MFVVIRFVKIVDLVAYTTTNISFSGQRRPRQYLFVDQNRALSLGQKKPFVIDAMRLAKIPVTLEFFPDLERGICRAFGSDLLAVERVTDKIHRLMTEGWTPETIDLTVPLVPKVGR